MKTILIVALALTAVAAPHAALSQVAAGAVANTFDGAAQVPPVQTPAQAQAEPQTQAQAPDIARAEDALRNVIASAQGAGFNYAVFTPDLGGRMRQLAPQLIPLIKSFGEVRSVDFMAAEGDAQLFRITFDNKVTEWMILFDPEDRIAGLRFRPVEE
jgi:hypothetical protein